MGTNPRIRTTHSISDAVAFAMATHVRDHYRLKFSEDETPRGCFVVLSPAGEVLVQTSMGEWQPRHNRTAHKKARTALYLQTNTGPLDPKMASHGRDIET